ncbi:1-deoxy-D-xylulose-5-phosphate synthase [Synoicihabitans lomoniglobus]|uniref:1-deoxy-D-xylulose-5-phosphate synthase n=1 Tax=Synoicihabitans lomoniglobus TaxID=2909285 RepID=A0AAF0CSR3_9BACT|nr:1-deoxy-D-xylulose-5-phosphate synthase [Opitutaceae bacterium LMO-M01]WED67316.1 1-deoxy-D-xylulose-5-phosphate synthase [Opitutaceae bacterium LMO-M01]
MSPHAEPAAPFSDTPLLPSIKGPADVKALPAAALPQLAQEIRDEIIDVTSVNGGHVGPNLGVVELCIGLHRVFSTPTDQFVFDVAHQGYVHKLLTGRSGEFFRGLRKTEGASGFLYRAESKHDAFGAGHAGTALSAALGMATARDLKGTDEHVVAVCGDAAFTCGVTLEALNNVVASTKRLIVILNDNEWSIARNVGAIAHYLNRLSTNPTYNKIHHDLERFFTSLPGGNEMHRLYSKWKRETKDFFMESSLFEKFGLRYVGPIDGHDQEELIKNLEFAKECDQPILLHVITKKGRGLPAALKSPEKFHGASPYDPATGESTAAKGTAPNYQDVMGQALTRFALADSRVVGITGAMPAGTGLTHLEKGCPRQFFDVGIAEEHAVLFAAGLATKGLRPVCAIYSTFLQRGYDQIIHDVALQNLPVTFCMDRAGLSANDGPTHHGLFDIAYLRCVPGVTVMQPKDEDELVDMLHTCLQLEGPGFIRYPRGAGQGVAIKETPATLPIGKAEVVRDGQDIMIWALGPMVQEALELATRLETDDGLSVGVVNARFAKPLDRDLLIEQAKTVSMIVTMEDHVVTGGFGTAVLEALQEAHLSTAIERIGWPDNFVEHGSTVEILRAAHGLAPDDIRHRVIQRWQRRHSIPIEADA